jgi:probable HAF family extracellular repeat protein
MNRGTTVTAWLLATAISVPVARAQVNRYTVTDLGTLGGSFGQANSVNVYARVAGVATTTNDAAAHAFTWSKKKGMLDLGTLPGGFNSTAQGINGFGEVVGSSDFDDPVNGLVTRAFLYTNGQMQDLGTIGGSAANANGINPEGQVVGASFVTGDTADHAVLWDGGQPTDLGTLGGTNSQAFAINSEGEQIVGSSDTVTGATDAVLWDSEDGLLDLGTLGGLSAQANAINDSGTVVGFSSLSGELVTDAFVYSNEKMLDIGGLGGSFASATGVNDRGNVVGFSNTTGDADVHAFIWRQKGGMQDLNNLIPAGSGWDLNTASAISATGRIVGSGTINGQQHGFLLTPSR